MDFIMKHDRKFLTILFKTLMINMVHDINIGSFITLVDREDSLVI